MNFWAAGVGNRVFYVWLVIRRSNEFNDLHAGSLAGLGRSRRVVDPEGWSLPKGLPVLPQYPRRHPWTSGRLRKHIVLYLGHVFKKSRGIKHIREKGLVAFEGVVANVGGPDGRRNWQCPSGLRTGSRTASKGLGNGRVAWRAENRSTRLYASRKGILW